MTTKQTILDKVPTQRNCLIALVFLFLLMAFYIGTMPYNPMTDDIADATTNAIWTQQYSRGVYEIPFQWHNLIIEVLKNHTQHFSHVKI